MTDNMKTVSIRGLEFGSGLPKVIIPIAESRDSTIFSQAREFRSRPTDIVEWRADYYDSVRDTEALLKTLKKLKKLLGDIPLIFTCRMEAFGGRLVWDIPSYYAMHHAVVVSGLVDAIDLIIGQADEEMRELIQLAHSSGVAVIGSYNDPEKTPSAEEMLEITRRIQDYPVDIIKLSVMAHDPADAVRVLDVTQKITSTFMDRPFMAMAMGSSGMITRIAGEAVGSCATYGAVGAGSAPGQFPVERLQSAIRILHHGMITQSE